MVYNVLRSLSKKYVAGFCNYKNNLFLCKKIVQENVYSFCKDYEFKSKSEEEQLMRWEKYICDEYKIDVMKADKEKPEYNLQQNFER